MKRWIHAATIQNSLLPQIEFDGSETYEWPESKYAPSITDYQFYFHTDLNSDNIASIKNIFDALFESASAEVDTVSNIVDSCELYLVINYVDEESFSKSVTWRIEVDTANISNVGYVTVSPGKVFEKGSAKDIQQRLVNFCQQYQSKPLSNYIKKKCINATLDYFTEQN